MDRECDVCGKRFGTQPARDQHREAKHIHFGCDDCGREFRSEQSLHQHRQAKHASSKTKNKKAPPRKLTDPPVPDLEGEWVEPSAFRGTKSFGFFMCPKCTNAPTWYSAHTFPNFKQGCKVSNAETLPQFLWQNAEWSFRGDRHEGDKLKGPHQLERCEACRAGVCVEN